jgi:hypothetical protein
LTNQVHNIVALIAENALKLAYAYLFFTKFCVDKNRFIKVLNLSPKIYSNSLPFKGEGRKRRDGKGKKGKRGEGRRGTIPQIKFYDYSTDVTAGSRVQQQSTLNGSPAITGRAISIHCIHDH